MSSAFRLLVVAENEDGYVVGRHDLGLYVAVPQPGAVLVEVLRNGGSLSEATVRASAVAGVDIDGDDFVNGLAAAGLLAPSVGGEPDGAHTGARRRAGTLRIRWIEGVSPRVARRLFGPVAWTMYASAALTAGGLLIAFPDLRPTYESAWFLTDPVLSVLAYLPLAVILGAIHEAWHWLAGRAIGVPAVFRVSYRGIFVVFETDLTQLVTKPRRQRYGPFLAGMAIDCCVLACALGIRLAGQRDVLSIPPVLFRALGAVVLYQLLALVWQWAALFARSDGYAILANALRCHDLNRATWLTTKWRFWRLTEAEARELGQISPHDRAVARWFGFLAVLGLLGMASALLSYRIPFLVLIGAWTAKNLEVFSVSWSAVEALAMLLYLLLAYAGPPLLALRERSLRRAGRLR